MGHVLKEIIYNKLSDKFDKNHYRDNKEPYSVLLNKEMYSIGQLTLK